MSNQNKYNKMIDSAVDGAYNIAGVAGELLQKAVEGYVEILKNTPELPDIPIEDGKIPFIHRITFGFFLQEEIKDGPLVELGRELDNRKKLFE